VCLVARGFAVCGMVPWSSRVASLVARLSNSPCFSVGGLVCRVSSGVDWTSEGLVVSS
jgi:hypothetical protein